MRMLSFWGFITKDVKCKQEKKKNTKKVEETQF